VFGKKDNTNTIELSDIATGIGGFIINVLNTIPYIHICMLTQQHISCVMRVTKKNKRQNKKQNKTITRQKMHKKPPKNKTKKKTRQTNKQNA
jgi:hypothetical protein